MIFPVGLLEKMNTFIRQNTGSKNTQRQIYTTEKNASQDNIVFKSTPDTPGGIGFRHKNSLQHTIISKII